MLQDVPLPSVMHTPTHEDEDEKEKDFKRPPTMISSEVIESAINVMPENSIVGRCDRSPSNSSNNDNPGQVRLSIDEHRYDSYQKGSTYFIFIFL